MSTGDANGGVYAVGDIHGRSDCLETVFERIDAEPEHD